MSPFPSAESHSLPVRISCFCLLPLLPPGDLENLPFSSISDALFLLLRQWNRRLSAVRRLTSLSTAARGPWKSPHVLYFRASCPLLSPRNRRLSAVRRLTSLSTAARGPRKSPLFLYFHHLMSPFPSAESSSVRCPASDFSFYCRPGISKISPFLLFPTPYFSFFVCGISFFFRQRNLILYRSGSPAFALFPSCRPGTSKISPVPLFPPPYFSFFVSGTGVCPLSGV